MTTPLKVAAIETDPREVFVWIEGPNLSIVRSAEARKLAAEALADAGIAGVGFSNFDAMAFVRPDGTVSPLQDDDLLKAGAAAGLRYRQRLKFSFRL